MKRETRNEGYGNIWSEQTLSQSIHLKIEPQIEGYGNSAAAADASTDSILKIELQMEGYGNSSKSWKFLRSFLGWKYDPK